MRINVGRLRLERHLAIIWFVAILWLPLLGGFFEGEWPGVKINEKRTLAGIPRPSLGKLTEFPKACDAYFQDHFGFRNSLIRLNAKIRYEVLGLRPERVLWGRDNWLYLAQDRELDDLTGARPFQDREIDLWRRVIEGRQAWLAERGINYLFVIAPNKSSVYPENLPEDLAERRLRSRLDQLMAGLRGSKANVLDLRPVLIGAKAKTLVYFPRDTHWSHWGGFYAYQAIIGGLAKFFPDMKAPGPEEYRLEKYNNFGDLANMLALGEAGFNQEFERPVLIKGQGERIKAPMPEGYVKPDCPDWRKPRAFRNRAAVRRLLMMHDSFAYIGLVQNLTAHFNLSVFVFEHTRYESLKLLVEELRPQVVIEEIVERDLVDVPEDHPEWAAARWRAAGWLEERLNHEGVDVGSRWDGNPTQGSRKGEVSE